MFSVSFVSSITLDFISLKGNFLLLNVLTVVLRNDLLNSSKDIYYLLKFNKGKIVLDDLLISYY